MTAKTAFDDTDLLESERTAFNRGYLAGWDAGYSKARPRQDTKAPKPHPCAECHHRSPDGWCSLTMYKPIQSCGHFVQRVDRTR